ncbi:uncharacterized protein LOC121598828 isoform X1 [Anopheles merus]|uniref:uncharacterized protein LOC121598828 isoform X1 n=1 Tax=Anopheles merus TaxID=30066 RepID=UPI001BE438E9|nr:uncharacterized protein LOC121598828 isoform X1 [Anopheles merus]
MVSDSQKRKAIREFLIPDTLKDDIAYCQRSLRDCVKVHQYFAQRYNSLSAIQQGQVKQYLLELEDEMRAIGKEQSGLVQDLGRRLKHFQRKTATEKHIELGDDLANGYVAWVLSSHAEIQCSAAYVPHAVSERLNESQLYQKYPLLSCAAAEATTAAQPEQERKPDTVRLRKRPVLQTSLLKPKEERDLLHNNNNNTALKEKPSPATRSPPSCTMSTPPPPVLPGPARTGNRRKTPPEQPLVPTKILRSRSTTPVVVTVLKQEPKQELVEPEPPTAAVNDTEDRATPPIVIRETAAVKRGRSNLLQALSKVKTTQKPATKPLPPTATTATTTTSPPGSASKSGRNCRAGSVSASSDSSNSRASTPGTSGGTAVQPKQTDEPVSAERLPPLSLPLLPPEEPTGTLPTSIDELEQYSFLKMFALHTIEDSNLLKGRKNERKRRSCCSTERKEYHYGRFDYYEQQFYIVQKRRYNANKRLLYTATSAEKAISARKPWAGGGVAIPPSPPPPSSSSQPVQDTPVVEVKPAQLEAVSEEELQPENKLCCVVCNQIAGTSNEELHACADCSNNYHLSCHRQVDDVDGETEQKTVPKPAPPAEDGNGGEEANDRQQPPERSNRCPACLALASIQQ